MNEIGLCNVHEEYNQIEKSNRKNTHRKGRSYVDTCAATHSLLRYISGYRMIEHAEIIEIDHRGYIFDVNLQEYMNVSSDKIQTRVSMLIDSRRKRHREKFCNKAEELVKSLNLENALDEIVKRVNKQIT